MALLIGGLVAAAGYFGYSKMVDLTSPTPLTVKSYDGGDETFNSTQPKVADFSRDIKHHKSATLRLNADEINTLIARNSEFIKSKIRLFVTLNDTEATMECSVPVSKVTGLLPANRYLNGTLTFGLDFDETEKDINFDIRTIQVGDKIVLGEGAESTSDSQDAFNKSFLKSFIPSFNKSLNDGLKKSTETKAFLDNIKSMEIKDSELVIESE